jgi:hypothetical protein
MVSDRVLLRAGGGGRVSGELVGAMSIPYETATAGDRALAECQNILAKFGCERFGVMQDVERGCTLVQFQWRNRQISLEASWKGYAAAWQRRHPFSGHYGTRGSWDQKALAIGKVAVCSILRDWLKGQTTAIECGVMSFDAVFMPHMLLPSGERVLDRMEREVLAQLPQSKVVEFKP